MPKPPVVAIDSPCADPFEFVQTPETEPDVDLKHGPDQRLAIFEQREHWVERQGFPMYHHYSIRPTASIKTIPIFFYKDTGPILDCLKTPTITKHTRQESRPSLLVPLCKGPHPPHYKTPRPKVVQTSS